MLETLIRTDDSPAPLAMRLGLGGTALVHGAVTTTLALGMGDGPASAADRLGRAFGVPTVLGIPVAVVLTIGALLLICGWFTRVQAALLAAVAALGLATTLVADATWAERYFQLGAYLLGLTLAVALVSTGGGRLSVDRLAVWRTATVAA